MEINLLNYIFFSERSIIYEENNIWKKYIIWSNSLLFEGELLNGKRNGKGKKYCGNNN